MRFEFVGRPMQILLVEHCLHLARMAMQTLRSRRVKLTWLRDGEGALEFLHRQGKYVEAPRPDLILLDLLLPKRDGWDVLSEIHSDAELKQVPVIALTGSADGSDVDQIRSRHFDVATCLAKPVNRDRLVRRQLLLRVSDN